VATSKPQSGLPPPDPLAAGDPLASAAPAKPRKKAAKSSRGIIVAVAAIAVIAAAAAAWIFTHGKKAAPTAAVATLTREADPPVVPPPAHEAIRPSPDELPGSGSSLATSLAIVGTAATNVGEIDTAAPVNPRVARWEIRFPPGAAVETYGHQLDALGIELGVIGGGDLISYAANFGHSQPSRRTGPGSDERRAFLVWRSGALSNLDAALLARAGVPAVGRLVVHFLPPQLEADLMAQEQEFAAPRNVAEVRRTAFSLLPDGEGFKFRVAEQEYFSGEVKKVSSKLPGGAKAKADAKAPAAK